MIVGKMNYLRRKSALKSTCPICGRFFTQYEDVQVIRLQEGRYTPYLFIHTSCALRHVHKDASEDCETGSMIMYGGL